MNKGKLRIKRPFTFFDGTPMTRDIDENLPRAELTMAETYHCEPDKEFFFEAASFTEKDVPKSDNIIMFGIKCIIKDSCQIEVGPQVQVNMENIHTHLYPDGFTINPSTKISLNSTLFFEVRTEGKFKKLGLHYKPTDKETAEVTPYIDTIAGRTSVINIKHVEKIAITMGLKTEPDQEEKSIVLDYFRVMQKK